MNEIKTSLKSLTVGSRFAMRGTGRLLAESVVTRDGQTLVGYLDLDLNLRSEFVRPALTSVVVFS